MRLQTWILAALAAAQIGALHAASADRIAAGGSLRQSEPVAGDLVAAGGEIRMAAPVAGNALLAGGDLRVSDTIGQNLYAGGGEISVQAVIGRNARLAGGSVEIAQTGQIGGNLSVAGGEVRIRGPVKGELRAAGGNVVIDSVVEGDAHVRAGELRLGPDARIGGKLYYRAKEFRQDPAAVVTGGIERKHQVGGDSDRRRDRTHDVRMFGGAGWLWTAGLLALAALLAGVFPAATQRIGTDLRKQPGIALLAGFVALVCVPFAAVLLMVTIIGVPLAIIMLMLYFVLLFVGYAATGVTLGLVALERFRAADASKLGWQIGAAVAATLLLALVGRVPFLGWMVAFAALVVGFGAVLMALRPRPAIVA